MDDGYEEDELPCCPECGCIDSEIVVDNAVVCTVCGCVVAP